MAEMFEVVEDKRVGEGSDVVKTESEFLELTTPDSDEGLVDVKESDGEASKSYRLKICTMR
jgi:hypothetical protein